MIVMKSRMKTPIPVTSPASSLVDKPLTAVGSSVTSSRDPSHYDIMYIIIKVTTLDLL